MTLARPLRMSTLDDGFQAAFADGANWAVAVQMEGTLEYLQLRCVGSGPENDELVRQGHQ